MKRETKRRRFVCEPNADGVFEVVPTKPKSRVTIEINGKAIGSFDAYVAEFVREAQPTPNAKAPTK